MKKVTLKKNEIVKPGYLWVFANQIEDKLSSYQPGSLVEIYDNRERFIGIGYINPNSLIAVRILTQKKENIDMTFFKKNISNAINYRKEIGLYDKDAVRLIFGESDRLPGLIVDKYGKNLSIQVLTAGMELLFSMVKDILIELLEPDTIILRDDSSFRLLEGLELKTEIIHGKFEEMPIIEEEGVKYYVDLVHGQKTGFFLDQRDNRIYMRKLLEKKNIKKLLDCFSYSGGWAISAASVISGDIICVDASQRALELVQKNAELNNKKILTVKSDVFDFLQEAHKKNEKFDCIILDPPAFIKNKSRIKEGIKGYREINQRAMKLLNKGGILITSSCSYHMSRELFLELIRSCAFQSGKSFRVVYFGTQSKDHPVLLSMPETEYLKTIFLENLE